MHEFNPFYFSNTPTQLLKLNLLSDSQEQFERGTPDFPCSAYIADFQKFLTGVYPFHWHDELQFTVALENSLTFNINGDTIILEQGQGIFINSKVLHSIKSSNNSPCKRQDIIFQPNILYGNHQNVYYKKYIFPLMNCRNLPYIKFSAADEWSYEILDNFNQAFQSLSLQPFGFELMVRNNLSLICILICNKYDQLIHSSSDIQGINELRVRLMINYIYKNYSKPITILQIADSANISERECFRCFKQILNTTPITFLKRHRIAMSIVLLENVQKSIVEISFLCGFNTPSYFIKTFKEITNYTPKEYRKQFIQFQE